MTELTEEDWLPWLRLSMAVGIGRVRANALLDRYGTPEGVFARTERELVEGTRLPAGVAARLASPLGIAEAKNELARLRKLGVRLCHLRGEEYPSLLGDVHHPPVVLGRLGVMADPGRAVVAIVGSRRAGPRSCRIAFEFAREIASAGVVVVSGLARGVDRAAHEGALAAPDGRTIAVLGHGLSRIYPYEHKALADRIRERGALLSEFPADAPPSGEHFPMRNRIIAGISAAVVVIAAGDESGALITARNANEAGREVFAVPGSIDDELARGCNRLLKEGAHLLEGAREVLLTLGLARPVPGSDERPPLRPRAARPPLTGIPAEIETFIEASGRPCTFDEIVFENKIDARAAMAALGFLALRRRVREIPGVGYAVAED